MKKVLFITHMFPPCADVGVIRVLKFIKFLDKMGWKTFVLTSRKLLEARFRDDKLSAEIPQGTKIVKCQDLNLWLNIMDRINMLAKFELKALSWIPFALANGIKLARESDILFSTAPPLSNHIVGLLLSKICRKPIVMDYRDTVTFTPLAPSKSIYNKLSYPLEAACVKRADKVVCTSKGLQSDLIRYFGLSKTTYVYSGFDPEDFEQKSSSNHDQLAISYIGSLATGHHPKLFLEGLKEFLRIRPEANDRILVRFAGAHSPEVKKEIEEMKLSKIVQLKGVLPRKEAITLMKESDVLLLLLTPMGREKIDFTRILYAIPMKTFEYIGARKLIFAIVLEGNECVDIVKACRGVVISINPNDLSPDSDLFVVNRVVQELCSIYNLWKTESLNCDSVDIEKFSVEFSAKRLDEILNALI
jgi:glycosyltransferase involved in cell wall biosynthesis